MKKKISRHVNSEKKMSEKRMRKKTYCVALQKYIHKQ